MIGVLPFAVEMVVVLRGAKTLDPGLRCRPAAGGTRLDPPMHSGQHLFKFGKDGECLLDKVLFCSSSQR